MNNYIDFEIDNERPDGKFTPWGGHREIAYYLVSEVKPKSIVELGTHWGVSLFSFLQAIKDNCLDTKVHAIDTWEGESHAGIYGEEVFNFIKNSKKKYFNDIECSLIRKFFDDAVQLFDDNSVDIIHIDGLHTYEATKNDYYNWLPKLSSNGIIIFHDIAANVDYGSRLFWDEIKGSYPYFESDHSWGIGILFPKGNLNYKKLLNDNFHDKLILFKYKYLSDLYSVQLKKAENLINEKDQLIKLTENIAEERLALVRSTEEISNARFNIMKKLERELTKIPKIVRFIFGKLS
nr:putative monosaccharide biosynthesis protein [Vibrio mimicus]